MQVTTEQPDPCTLVLDISVEADHVSRVFDSTYREFSRYVNVPGFRPGKAPRALLERYVNQERLIQRANEMLVNEVVGEYLTEQDITPFRNPALDAEPIEDKKPYAFKVTVPLEPQVTLSEYTGIQVERPLFPISEKMIVDRLERYRNEHARVERVTDRPVVEGDLLIAEVSSQAEGDEEATPKRRQLIQLGGANPAFDENLIGAEIGEEKSFDYTYAEDYADEALAGKKVSYTVKVASISAKKLPELNDEFAQKLGAESLEVLKADSRTAMEAEVKRLGDYVAEQRIIETIVNSATIHFPQVLVREEAEDAYRQLAAEIRQKGLSYEYWLQANDLTPETHAQAVTEQATERVRTILALRQIAIQESFQVTDEAIDAEYANLLNQGRITDEQFETWILDNRRRMQVANALVQQTLHDFLFANNILTDVEQQAPPDPVELAEANEEIEATDE
jgi:trigger factor